MEEKSKNKVNIKYIYLFYIPLVVLSKIIRYTLMKTVLVDQGMGWGVIDDIVNNSYKLKLFQLSADATENSCALFSLLNVFELNTYFSLEIYVTVLWNILTLWVISKSKDKLTVMEAIFIVCSIAVLNIFDFCIAKEPMQMLYFVIIFVILISKQSKSSKFVLSMLMILFATISYRKYYIIIAFFIIVAKILCEGLKMENKKIVTITEKIILVGIIYFVFLNVVKVIFPTEYAELIRVRTRTSEATSDMRTILPGASSNLVIFCIDYMIMIVRMMCPIELLPLGIKYFPYIIYQLMISYYVIKALERIHEKNETRNLALYIYLGFLFGSATFEPDFGSWVRHEAVIFPVLLVLSNVEKIKYIDRGKKIKEKKDGSCKGVN